MLYSSQHNFQRFYTKLLYLIPQSELLGSRPSHATGPSFRGRWIGTTQVCEGENTDLCIGARENHWKGQVGLPVASAVSSRCEMSTYFTKRFGTTFSMFHTRIIGLGGSDGFPERHLEHNRMECCFLHGISNAASCILTVGLHWSAASIPSLVSPTSLCFHYNFLFSIAQKVGSWWRKFNTVMTVWQNAVSHRFGRMARCRVTPFRPRDTMSCHSLLTYFLVGFKSFKLFCAT